MVPGKELWNASETARRLKLSVPHVYTLASAGTLPSIKFGKAVRFDPKDVEIFIQQHRRAITKVASVKEARYAAR